MRIENVFNIIPASSSTFIFISVIAVIIAAILIVPAYQGELDLLSVPGIITWVVLLSVLGLFISFGYQAKRVTFNLTEGGLRIGPGLYGRTIPRDKIDIHGVRVLNLESDKEYRPKWRLNGAGFPGFSLGWFKLHNKEKALLFLTDRSSVVYVPTRDNYAVLLSTRDAYEMVNQIKNWG